MNADSIKRLEELIEKNSNLLSMEGSKKIIEYAKGQENFYTPISSFDKEGVFSFRGTVSSTGKIREIPREDKNLRLLKIEVSDDSGTITVNLWNREIDYYSDIIIKDNKLIFIDCRLTINNYGSQISLGDKGFIVEPQKS